MDGFLLVDKPVGISSFGVVARVKRIIRDQTGQKIKVGHTGTLDPLASGLIILVLGSYTKRAGEFSKMDKTYEVEISLGATSATGDKEGPITPKNKKVPPDNDVRAVLSTFEGEIKQTPHIHSAIKIGGQRAYKLARAGKKVKIEPRTIIIHSIKSIRYKYPKLSFETEVSSGTYIRSLAGDIGQRLGTGAYVSALRRTKVGQYDIKDAIIPDLIDIKVIQTGVVRTP